MTDVRLGDIDDQSSLQFLKDDQFIKQQQSCVAAAAAAATASGLAMSLGVDWTARLTRRRRCGRRAT